MILPVKYSKLSPTQKRMVREEYTRQQGGKCYYCKESLTSKPSNKILSDWIYWKMFPGGEEGFLKYPVHLHHCHDTDDTLGAVHAFCNAHSFQYLGI